MTAACDDSGMPSRDDSGSSHGDSGTSSRGDSDTSLFGSLLQQVGDVVVVVLFLSGLTAVVGPLDLLVSSLGVALPHFSGLIAAGIVGVGIVLVRPLRLRLVVRVWVVGLVTTVVSTTLLVFFQLEGNTAGIALTWALGVALGLVMAYPPFWKRAEARLRVD
ncbi:hypothetical protein C455_14642 [Haloferax larsenii JCM 13917]|nr:hypothetical protein [Haloferax larsenii]ELZ77034.1 hypothetical protein C455_14642 [Haloferax larsenii JCM 13917]